MNTHECPKCRGEMEKGYLQGYAAPTMWIASGPKWTFRDLFKAGVRKQRRVECHRCTACGYLESYAKSVIGLQ